MKQKILMNKNGDISLGIPLTIFENDDDVLLETLEGYKVSVSLAKPVAWAIFSGADDASGPWIVVWQDIIEEHGIEDIGYL